MRKKTASDNCQLRGDCLVNQQLSLHPPAVKQQPLLIVSNNFDKTLVVLNFLPSFLAFLKQKSINGTIKDYKDIFILGKKYLVMTVNPFFLICENRTVKNTRVKFIW